IANERRQRGAGLAALFLCGGVLAVTRSVASVLTAVIVLAATVSLVAARAYRRAAPVIVATVTLTTMAIVLALIGTKPGLRLLARSETFSDRTHIWRVVAAGAAEDAWLGHGYGAFWTGPAGPKALAMIRMSI